MTEANMESWPTQARGALDRSVVETINKDLPLMDCANNNDQPMSLSTSTSNTNLSIDSIPSETRGAIDEELKTVFNRENISSGLVSEYLSSDRLSGSIVQQCAISLEGGSGPSTGIENTVNGSGVVYNSGNLMDQWSEINLLAHDAKIDGSSNRVGTSSNGYSVNPFAPPSIAPMMRDDPRMMQPPMPTFGTAPPSSIYCDAGGLRLQNPLGSLFPLSEVPALSMDNNGFHGTHFNDPLIPKLQIGSFNLPTYGESSDRFNKVLKRKINEIGKVANPKVRGTRSTDFVYLSSDTDMVQHDKIYGQGDRPSKQTLSSLSASTTVSGIDMSSIPNFETPSYPQTCRDGLDSGAKTLFNLSPVADNHHFATLSVSNSMTNYLTSRASPGIRDETAADNMMLNMCLCCPGNYHQGSTPVCVPGLANLNAGIIMDHGNNDNSSLDSQCDGDLSAYSSRHFNLSNEISLRLPLPRKMLGINSEIDWNEPYMEVDVPESLLKQLVMFGFMSSSRILSPFELSIFRTVMCVHSQSCENARSPIKCWASHNFTKSHESRRWKRRNPFIYDYKHLMCPKIQSLKDALRARADTVDGGQKYIDKNALQQACFQCEDGTHCSYSHSLEEQMYHPFVYKTAICANQKNSNGCARPFCPFLHENEYFYDHEGNTKPRLYDSLHAWTTTKGSRRNRQFGKDGEYSDAVSVVDNSSPMAQSPVGKSVSRSSVHELATPNNNTSTPMGPVIYDTSYANFPWAPQNEAINETFLPLIGGPPLDRDDPYKEENVDPVFARRIAQELFTDCHVPLSSLELSVFRTTRCPFKNACENNKTPTRCWATHASDGSNRWLRRNPWLFPYKHLICPVVRKEKDCNDGKPKWHACPKGRNCNLAHSIEEQMYHPFVYKTTNCVHKNCDKPYCPFIHQGEQQRPFQSIEMIENCGNSSVNESGSRRTSRAKGGKRWNKGTANQNRRQI